jgi:hypothetical protein
MIYIGKKFNLEYTKGIPRFSQPWTEEEKHQKPDLSRWAWDWLNLYLYEFHFSKENSKEKIMFSIVFQADTGKWDMEVDQLEVDKYKKAEKTKTKLIFVFSNKEYWDIKRAIDGEADGRHDCSPVVKFLSDSKHMVGNEYEKEYIIENEKHEKAYCKIFELRDFKNKKETDLALDEFVKYLEQNEIFDISIVEEV